MSELKNVSLENEEITIVKVVKINENEYLLNEHVKLQNLDFEGENVVYDIDYDDDEVSECVAIKTCEAFLREAFENTIKEHNEEKRSMARASQLGSINS